MNYSSVNYYYRDVDLEVMLLHCVIVIVPLQMPHSAALGGRVLAWMDPVCQLMCIIQF